MITFSKLPVLYCSLYYIRFNCISYNGSKILKSFQLKFPGRGWTSSCQERAPTEHPGIKGSLQEETETSGGHQTSRTVSTTTRWWWWQIGPWFFNAGSPLHESGVTLQIDPARPGDGWWRLPTSGGKGESSVLSTFSRAASVSVGYGVANAFGDAKGEAHYARSKGKSSGNDAAHFASLFILIITFPFLFSFTKGQK